MYLNQKILSSKLRFSGATDCIARQRLFPLFKQVLEKRLTLVVAGAGYGKSTLAMQIVNYLNIDTAWYRLDINDRDFTTFVTYLLNSIVVGLPESDTDSLNRVYDALNTDQDCESTLTTLIHVLEQQVQYPLLIVLDDFHWVDESPEIVGAIEFLLEHLPSEIHLLMLSRNNPTMRLSKNRVRRELLEITEADLTFTPEEIDDLYATFFELSLKAESLHHLHARTGGWVASLILFVNSIRESSRKIYKSDINTKSEINNKSDIDDYILSLKGSNRMINSYLEENIYNAQTEETKNFLLKSALFSKINVAVCNRFLNIHNASDILSKLEQRHLFTSSLDDEGLWYSYQHLFQQFLTQQLLKQRGQQEINQLHLELAKAWEIEGDDEEALNHCLEGLHIKEACAVLNRISKLLWYKGRLADIQAYIKRIPIDFIEREPWLQYMQAQAKDLAGEGAAAFELYEKTKLTFLKNQDSDGAQWCKLNLGYYQFMCAEFPQATRTVEEVIQHSRHNNPRMLCNALNDLAQVYVAIGDLEKADQYYHESLAIAAEIKDPEWRQFLHATLYLTRATRLLFAGEFLQCEEFCQKACAILVHHGFHVGLTHYYYLMSLVHFYLGEYASGLQHAQAGLELMQKRNFEHFFSSGWLLSAAALNAFGQGKTDEALSYARLGNKKLQDLGYRWGIIVSLWTLERMHLANQHVEPKAAVMADWEKATHGFQAPALPEGLFRLAKATELLEQNDQREEEQQRRSADKLLKPFNLFNHFVRFLAVCQQFMHEDKQLAQANLVTLLTSCEAMHFHAWLVFEQHWILPMLAELYSQGKLLDYLAAAFRKNGAAVKGKLLKLQARSKPKIKLALTDLQSLAPQMTPPELHVSCLGHFKLTIGSHRVPSERWRNLKAKTLFQYLIFRRASGYVAKDILIEILWPDEDPEKTINRFHVTLSNLRKILEPNLAKGEASAYILNQKDSYRIFLGPGATLDLDDFSRAISLAKEHKGDPERAIAHYLQAESLYVGDFLDDSPYSDWCLPERERLQGDYLQTLQAIITYYEERLDYQKGIKYAQKYLQVDRYEERIYQRLMTFYAKTKNRAMITLTHERCKEKLAEELGCPLSIDTEKLYQTLLANCSN